jgi:hypothetical protein
MAFYWVVDLSDDATLARFHKSKESSDDIRTGKVRSDFFAGLFDVEIRAVEETVGLTECASVLGYEATALESDLIDSTDFGGVAIRNHVGRDILNNFRATSDDRVLSETAELMHSGEPANDDMVLDCDMPSDGSVI